MSFLVARALALVAALAFSFSCVTLAPEAERVRVTRDKADVVGCTALGFVDAQPPFVGPDDAKNEMRNKAGVLGADVLLITNYGMKADGVAYDCRKPEPASK